jgi:hypothetical protein
MTPRFITALFSIALLYTVANASGAPTFPFVDGRWSGDIKTFQNNTEFEECWASTTFTDGTTFTLAERRDESWYLRLSNAGWRLVPSRRYPMVAQVDFYPPHLVDAEAKSQRLLEIATLDQNTLLGFIENGHTIKLTSDRFKEAYDLEGSAKVIGRIRTCVTDQLAAEMPAAAAGPTPRE